MNRLLSLLVVLVGRFTGRGGDDVGVIGSDLLSGTGELTQVGSVFVNTYQDLQRCEDFTSTMNSATSAANNEVVPSAEITGEHCCSGVE